MLRRLTLAAVLVAAAAALTVPAASAARTASTLLFCSDVSYPPEEFVQGGKTVGSDIDIAAEVAKRLGMSVKIQNTGFDGIVAALLSNKCDAIISGMNDTPERRKSIAFVDYLNVGQSFIAKKGNPLGIKVPLDICGHAAGAQVATTNLQTLQSLDKKCKAKGKKGIKIVSFKEDPLGVTALKTGHIDIYESDSPPAVWYTTQDKSLQIVGPPVDAIPVGIGVKKGSSLQPKIQKAINAMYKDGTMKKILKKWNMSQFALKKT
ncbi:MAG TPA: ABC transporter substrate-binding protein [Gaiellaceae bacterium]|nr:ABC transporter substrate-binding protein [Gaiellaceae bacterium]